MNKLSIFNDHFPDFHINGVQYNSACLGSYQSQGYRGTCELIYKIDGCSRQHFHGCVIDLVPDSIFFIPAETKNTYTVTEPGTIINIRFSLYDASETMPYSPELIELKPGNRFKSLFLRSYELWNKKEPGYYLHTHAVVSEILAYLVAEREHLYIQSGKYAKIAPALDHIRAHFRDPISVSAMAEMCGISEEYLRTLFRSYTGQTPLAYINTLRLEYARDLLQSGGLSVSDVAQRSGFDSPEYFSRIFKKSYNLSPSKMNTVKITLPEVYLQQKEDFQS